MHIIYLKFIRGDRAGEKNKACLLFQADLTIWYMSEPYSRITSNSPAKISAALAPLADHPQVRHLRQRGMIAAFDVATDDPFFSRKFYRAALEREALIRPIGNTVYLMPPYIVSDEEISHLARAITGAVASAL